MVEAGERSILTRRNWILMAGAGFAPCSNIRGFGKEFWEAKEPAEWSGDEIARLLMKSPWAKAASAERARRRGQPAVPGPRPRSTVGMGGPRARMPGGSGSTAPSKIVTTYKATVLWESATPVRAALKTKLPDGFEGQYVVGVSGVPLAKSEGKGAMDRLRQGSTLEIKNRQPLEAAVAQVKRERETVYLFGFAKEGLPLSRDDKEIEFTTHMGNLAFTAKFFPRDMLYHGKLSV